MGVSHFSAISATVSTLNKTLTGNVTLTALEAQDVGILKYDSAITAGCTITLPVAIEGKKLVVRNVATSSAVTVKVDGQTGITVATGKTAILGCDDTDVFRITADA